ncbi:putative porin [Microbulbifer yueqingensis]|uniref:Putative general porin n=1 Tax=Microbulbifer yueqingensis TaxID=658219 RepID=A0A1G9BNL2_9GAMM|nr:putative porin [Microbulbifer yueqingensis]SDK40850.1 Putative general porin [Microbulbifer yueqingensis]
MKLKYILPLALVSATASAEQYTSFTNAGYQNNDYGSGFETDSYDINSRYFFAPKENLGPLKEFEYINKVSNVYGGFSRLDYDGGDASGSNLGGELFAGNFKLGASFSEFEDVDSNTLTLGYLFSENFLLSLDSVDTDGADRENIVSARYNHQLGGTDYVGFNFAVDDDLDYAQVSSRYLRSLAGDSYLVLAGSVTDFDQGDSVWSAGAEYYFTRTTSVGFETVDGDTLGLDFTHFFNRSIAVNVAYAQTDEDFVDYDTFSLGLTAQL